MLKTTGVIIAPARFGSASAKEAARGATVDARGVATVAGGANVTGGAGKKATKDGKGVSGAQPQSGSTSRGKGGSEAKRR